MAYRISPPNLMVWLPWLRVQLFTNWNCCSLSVSGQLQRAASRPSPKAYVPALLLPNWPFTPPLLPLFWNRKPDKPPVVGGPAIPGPELSPGNPNVSIGDLVPSEYAVFGLYLKYPKRKSVSHLTPMAFVKPVAKL